MRVMVLVKADKSSEAGELPTEELIAAMMNYNEDLVKAGVLIDGDGLQPSSRGVRIHFSGADRTVSQGPFPHTSELVAGYWIWEVPSMEDAIAWAKRCPNPQLGSSDIEIRPFFTADDLGEAFTPELRAKEERLRQESGQRSD